MRTQTNSTPVLPRSASRWRAWGARGQPGLARQVNYAPGLIVAALADVITASSALGQVRHVAERMCLAIAPIRTRQDAATLQDQHVELRYLLQQRLLR